MWLLFVVVHRYVGADEGPLFKLQLQLELWYPQKLLCLMVSCRKSNKKIKTGMSYGNA